MGKLGLKTTKEDQSAARYRRDRLWTDRAPCDRLARRPHRVFRAPRVAAEHVTGHVEGSNDRNEDAGGSEIADGSNYRVSDAPGVLRSLTVRTTETKTRRVRRLLMAPTTA